jgi:hypothetical protein
MELTNSDSISRFDMCVVFTANYSFRGCDVLIDSKMLLVIDFMNLKIKPTQFVRGAHRDRICVCVFIWVSDRTCMSICVCTVFPKKE